MSTVLPLLKEVMLQYCHLTPFAFVAKNANGLGSCVVDSRDFEYGAEKSLLERISSISLFLIKFKNSI